MLKLGPSILKWLPGDKAKDLGAWMRSYGYWNQVTSAVVDAFGGLLR